MGDNLTSIGWPLCVTGYMTGRGMQNKRKWASEILGLAAQACPQLRSILGVIKNSWHIRDTGMNSDDCVWMEEIWETGYSTLLI